MDIDAKSPDGNIFFILASVRRLFKDIGRMKDWPEAEKRMKSGDYDNLCAVAEEVTYGSIRVVNRDAPKPKGN